MTINAHFERALTPRGERRTLLLETTGATGAETAAVRIHNISRGGLLIETTTVLDDGETIAVALPDLGAVAATVIWTSGNFYGCRFAEAIADATLSAVQLRAGPAVSPTSPAPPMPQGNGARLQRLRKQRGLTLAQVADRLGVSKPTVWAWEQGRSHPLPGRITALAEVLGVEEADLSASQGGDDRLATVLAKARREIAEAAETVPERIKIMIEL